MSPLTRFSRSADAIKFKTISVLFFPPATVKIGVKFLAHKLPQSSFVKSRNES